MNPVQTLHFDGTWVSQRHPKLEYPVLQGKDRWQIWQGLKTKAFGTPQGSAEALNKKYRRERGKSPFKTQMC